MSRTVFKLLSLWAFAALIALLALQALPATGPGLEELGAPVAAGWLVNLALLCLFLDALANRLPRFVLILPIVLYGSYAVAYWRQGTHVAERARQLKASNPGKVLAFDPQTHSLVMDRAAEFVATHAIPVAYARDLSFRPESYQSYRLAGVAQAAQAAKDATTEIQVFAVYLDDSKIENLRELRIPERPANRIVSVTTRTDTGGGWADWNIGADITEVSVEGKWIGTFKSGFVLRLPIVPHLAVGCRAGETGGLKCFAELAFNRRPIDSLPPSVNPVEFDDPVSVMLGLRKLTERELVAAKGFDLTVAASDAAQALAPRSKAALAALEAALAGQPSDTPAAIVVDALVRDPDRLAPFATAMANRFVELNQPGQSNDPNQREQTKILAGAIAALPQADFERVGDSVRDLLRRDGAWSEYPELYVRMADTGPAAFSFYRDRLLGADTARAERLLAALAICRIGQADGELMNALKTQFTTNDASDPHAAEFSTAMFVALLKLGQADYLQINARGDSAQLQAWYDALIAGKGQTPVGPNNCLSWDWAWPETLPAALAPRLRWIKGAWESGEGK
jgi:hypothetical protein